MMEVARRARTVEAVANFIFRKVLVKRLILVKTTDEIDWLRSR